VPSDGIVVEGESYVNEAFLTGESKPVHKEKDDKVIGGAVNGDGS
jgi:P-type Cu2+ transporter